MGIKSELNELSGRIQAAFDACESKGAVIPDTKNTYTLSAAIESIPNDTLLTKMLNDQPVDYASNEISGFPSWMLYKSTVRDVSSDSAYYIGDYAFADCKYLRSLSLSNVTRMSSNRNFNNSGLTSVSFPKLSSFGSSSGYNWQGCKNLQSVYLPHIALLNNYDFAGCESLSSITLDFDRLNQLGQYAFQNSKLRYFDITSPSIYTIPTGVFRDCTELEWIRFNKVTSSFGNYSLFGCDKLKSVVMMQQDKVPTVGTTSFALGEWPVSCYVPDALVDSFKTTGNWVTLISNGRVEIYGLSQLDNSILQK